MAKHTPEPWIAVGLTICEAEGQHRDIGEAFSRELYTVEISAEEAAANARLFASAPELLEALRRVFKDGHRMWCGIKNFRSTCNCGISEAEAAILKAKGKVDRG